MSLADYTDEQLRELLKTAGRRAREGRAVLGPMSAQAISIELNERGLYPKRRRSNWLRDRRIVRHEGPLGMSERTKPRRPKPAPLEEGEPDQIGIVREVPDLRHLGPLKTR